MTPIQQPSELFAHDIVLYSDAELDDYLEANGRMLAAASDMAQHRPIDLDDLTTRLEDIPPSPASTEDLGDEEYYRLVLEKQTEYYKTLVNEGGRPSHPVSMGRDVLQNAGKYREILAYWGFANPGDDGRDWDVFEPQLRRWRELREWQGNNREEGRFDKYTVRVKDGLAKHGFTRPFQLDEDPERQDKMTTWIEYLDYEYWWYDRDTTFVRRRQQRYDEAWKELVLSNVLKDVETEDSIWSIECTFRHASETEQAEKAVISAERAINDLERCSRSQRENQQTLAAAQSKLELARKSFESIKRRNDLVHKFFKEFGQTKVEKGSLMRSYKEVREDVQRRSILLRWILQQIPLIELELKTAKVPENDTNEGNGRKRKAEHDNDFNEGKTSDRRMRASIAKERVSKRLKLNSYNSHLFPQEIPSQECVDTADCRRSPSRTKSEGKATTKAVLTEQARVLESTRGGGKSSNLSALDSPRPRRSTRIRKQPLRYY